MSWANWYSNYHAYLNNWTFLSCPLSYRSRNGQGELGVWDKLQAVSCCIMQSCMYLNCNLESLWIIILKIDNHQSPSFYNWSTKIKLQDMMTEAWRLGLGRSLLAIFWCEKNLPISRDQVDQLLIQLLVLYFIT